AAAADRRVPARRRRGAAPGRAGGAVRQEAFERAREPRWRGLEALLDRLDQAPGAGAELPRLYRMVCQDLALARDRRFGAALVERLNALALRGHQRLYGARGGRGRPLEMLLHRFPAAVRREARLFAVVSLLFYGPALALFALDLVEPDLVYHVLGGAQTAELERMYDPEAEHYGAPRDTVGDFAAFSYYIGNNIGIAFRTFAGGILFGVGSLFFLVLNGVFLGVVAAHLTRLGHAGTFYPFVIGHGAFELTAIVLAGLAGLRLGLTLLVPTAFARATALRMAASGVVPILYGMTAMLVIAAVIEAFWSGSAVVPAPARLAT